MRDQSLGVRRLGTRLRKLGIASTKQTLERLDIIGQCLGGDGHGPRRTDSPPSTANLLRPESPCRTRSPGALGMAPVNRLQQIAELRRRDRHDAAGRRRSDEPATLEALGIERQSKPVVPEDLDQVAAASPEDVEITGIGVTTERFLDLKRKPFMPRRMSVTAVASHTLTSDGIGIIDDRGPRSPAPGLRRQPRHRQ